MADAPTPSTPAGAAPVTVLPELPPGWLRSRPASYWLWQTMAYLPAVLIDWALTSVSIDGGAYFTTAILWGLLLLFAVLYLPLLVRRRWPVLAFAVVLVVALVATLPGWGQPFLGVLVALHAVAALRPLAFSQAALFLALIPGLAQSYWTHLYVDDRPDLVDFLIPAIFFCGTTIVVWVIGRHEHANRLAAANLRQQVVLSEAVATDRERRRIAHELHDILSHSVSAMMMQAAGARALAQSTSRKHPEVTQLATVEDALNTIEQTGSQSLRELHRLLGALRGSEHAQETTDQSQEPRAAGSFEIEGSEGPGHLDLHELIESSTRSGLTVQLHHVGEHRPMDPSVNTAAYRVVQESLTNALKHGGRGAVVDVYETWLTNGLQLQVRSRAGHDRAEDGPTAPGSGTGLLGLRERLELVGGTFESGWVRDEFVTTAVLPLTSGAALTAAEGDEQ